MNVWAIVPVKPLRDSKSRLAHILSPDERAHLTAQLLARTLAVLGQVRDIHRIMVVSRDPAVLKIARKQGAVTFGEGDRQELNLALRRAAHIASAQQAEAVMILPSDLPLITTDDVAMVLAGIIPESNGHHTNGYYYQTRAIAICPDHMNDGTNAILVCPPTGFNFQYGAGSFNGHLEEAARLGMARRIVHAPGLKFDLDTEEDWATYQAIQCAHL
jgi:2-phospho-L-lactate/phosphoenolpyruvate guanylyltransferase